MFIQIWIIYVVVVIVVVLFAFWVGVSIDFEALKKKSFIRSELSSEKFNVKIIYFSLLNELQTQTRALSRLEMLMETSHYGQDMFNPQTFERFAKDLGYHHIAFSSLAENT